MDYKETLCRWAEKKYGIPDVVDVEFDQEFEEGVEYSEWTIEPGSAVIEVTVWYDTSSGNKYKVFQAEDLSNLIKEVCTFNG